MNKSAEIDQLAAALAAAQAEFQAVPKTAENPFFHSKYADLPSVVMAASPILSKHGIALSQMPDFDGENDLLTTLVMHKSGQWIEATARLHLVKADPQGQGSATTYMRRYAYSGGVGIVTDEDDDGNAASRPKGSSRSGKQTENGQARGGEPYTSPAGSRREQHSTVRRAPQTPRQAQMALMVKLFERSQITDAGERLRYASAVIGRDVSKAAELTDDETEQVVKNLQAILEAD